jgi:hypothetical protein
MGIPHPIREKPPEAEMVVGGIEIPGDHQRFARTTDLLPDTPELGLPLGSIAVERAAMCTV